MATPVLTYITPGDGPDCASHFKVSFYTPLKYQDDSNPPPEPTNEDVFIETIDPVTVAVTEFAGFATDDIVVQAAAALAQSIQEVGMEIDGESYFYAGYDPPFRLTNRHNEVWIPVKMSATKA